MSGWPQVPIARATFPCLGIKYGLVEISVLVDLVVTGSQLSFELKELIQTNNGSREVLTSTFAGSSVFLVDLADGGILHLNGVR